MGDMPATTKASPNGSRSALMVLVLGPTASGKTALGVDLAERLGCRVLSVDSRQIYRGMNLGTAKPNAAEQRGVPHELLNLSAPNQPLNLQQFCALASPLIKAEQAAGRPALLVGGSGLYLQALSQGLQPPGMAPQPWLREQLQQLGQGACHQLLQQADPEAAARIHRADAVRTQRALEVLYGTGKPLLQQQGRRPPPGQVLELGLDPSNLRQRINKRTAAMYAGGLVAETEALCGLYGANLPLLQTIGYGEALALLQGRLNEAEAQALTCQRTWQLAKRQRTWFRNRHKPLWLNPEAPLEEALAAIATLGA
jgi:tRNA dimethylallyltransferase